MKASSSNRYDSIIIGAGIGGLSAGAYLTKAGLKVAIIERMNKVGGYCGSFIKDGFVFDEAVHYINNLGPKGFLRIICQELNIEQSFNVVTVDPSDRLIMPDLEIAIYHDTEKSITELSSQFPDEAKAIRRFFKMIVDFDFATLYVEYKQLTFEALLDRLFKDHRLKTALGLFATTMGLTADQLSALAGLAYYKGSILDGGYHAIGGAQSFSNALCDRFYQLGGKVLLSRAVKHILVKAGCVKGVELEDGTRLEANTVIANCDATQTFEKLISREHIGENMVNRIKALKPSKSTLVVYLGINTSLKTRVPDCCNLWYFPYEDFRLSSLDIVEDDRPMGFVHIGLSSLHDKTMAPEGCESLVLFCGASYKTMEYWGRHKERLANILVERACQAIPALRGNIKFKLPASPHTLHRYTLNRDGAYRGWEPTPDQTKLGLMPQKTDIDGLYLAGHWVTTPVGNGGVSMVAQSGRTAAKAILRNTRKTVKITYIQR